MKVTENISLASFNSFGVEARAARLVEWETADELEELSTEGRWMALGGGNNILLTGDFDGTMVKSAARKIEVTGETAETLRVRAEAGVEWEEFVEWCVAQEVWGVENLAGIPGTVGAAPIQNIGAYGAEAGDVITTVECFAVERAAKMTIDREHLAFGYRDSVFKGALKGRVIVTAVNFELSKTPRPNLGYGALAEKAGKEPKPKNIAQAVREIRNSKLPDPRVTGNAGSFFKNPVVDMTLARRLAEANPEMPLYPAGGESGRAKLSAGWLIEQAGWKGRSVGRVGIDPRQALIVINRGGATGEEIVGFAQRVQTDVLQKFGVELTPEVNII